MCLQLYVAGISRRTHHEAPTPQPFRQSLHCTMHTMPTGRYLFFLEDNCKCHSNKSQECDGRTHNNATCAEDVGIEPVKLVAAAKHQQKANQNHCAANCHQHKVDAGEREIAIFNLVFFLLLYFWL